LSEVPPPDHPDANRKGCKCPTGEPNNQGAGTIVDGVKTYKISPECPLHSRPRAWFNKRYLKI